LKKQKQSTRSKTKQISSCICPDTSTFASWRSFFDFCPAWATPSC